MRHNELNYEKPVLTIYIFKEQDVIRTSDKIYDEDVEETNPDEMIFG